MKVWIATFALIASASAAAHAQQAPPPSEVRISLDAYEALVTAAKERGGPQATWSTAEVEITLPESPTDPFVDVTFEANVQVIGDGTAQVLLLPGHVILTSAEIDGSNATLMRESGAHVALLDGKGGRRRVSLSYRVPVRPTTDGATLAMVALPPVPSSEATITRGGVVGPIEVWPTGTVGRDGRDFQVSLSATHAAVIRWGAGQTALRRADYRMRMNPGSDGADIEARLEVNVTGARTHVRLAPSTLALTDVREGGKPVQTSVVGGWHEAIVVGQGAHTIVASFRVAIDRSQGQPEVTMPLNGAPITRVDAIVPGKRAVSFDPSVPVTQTTEGEDEAATTTATAFLPPSEEIKVSWTEPRTAPERVVSANTETYQLVKIDEGVVRSKVQVRYDIIRGTVQELFIELPDDGAVMLYKVRGEGIEDWRTFAATDGQPRQARIFLGAEREGTYELELQLEQPVSTEVGAALTLPLVRPIGSARERGVIALFDGDEFSFAKATTTNLKAGEDALPVEIRQKLAGDIVTQAFKHIGPPATVSTAVDEAKKKDVSFDARVEALYVFQQNALEVQATIKMEVKTGKTDRVVMSLPRDVKITHEPTAPSMKAARWEPVEDEAAPRRNYVIELTQAIGGHFDIQLNFGLTLPSELGAKAIPDIQVLDADVQKGVFGITSEPMMEVRQAEIEGLNKLDVSTLPKSVSLRAPRRHDVELGYSYSYAKGDKTPRLVLDVKRHKTVETLTAAITAAWLESSVFEEGQLVTTALFKVENKELNFLQLGMPPGAKVLAVMVDGEGVEPIADEAHALKIRIARQRTSLIELVYLVKRDELSMMPSIELVAPRPTLFVKDIQWLVRVPEKFTIYGTDSDLKASDNYVMPQTPLGKRAAVDLAILPSGEITERAFRLDLFDASETKTALSVELSLLATPGNWLNVLLFVLALLALSWLVWRRVRREPMALVSWGALSLGIVALVLKSIGWGISGGEAVFAIMLLAVIGAGTWIHRRTKEMLS